MGDALHQVPGEGGDGVALAFERLSPHESHDRRHRRRTQVCRADPDRRLPGEVPRLRASPRPADPRTVVRPVLASRTEASDTVVPLRSSHVSGRVQLWEMPAWSPAPERRREPRALRGAAACRHPRAEVPGAPARVAGRLAGMLLEDERVRALVEGSHVLVPVPLHPRRLRERGFNQAALLAEELGRRTGRPCGDRALVRRKDTSPQAGLSAAARRRNVAEAFAVRRRGLVAGRVVTLVDDVLDDRGDGSRVCTYAEGGGSPTRCGCSRWPGWSRGRQRRSWT